MNPKKFWAVALLLSVHEGAYAQISPSEPMAVTVDNFIRAESDMYFSAAAKQNGFGKFSHHREPMNIDHQTVVRANRDTIYSSGVFDLDAGPVTVTLPDAAERFMSMQAINEDHYVSAVVYGAGEYTFTRKQVGTRYVILGIRTLVDPSSPNDLNQVHMLQDAIRVKQAANGTFDVPRWDPVSQKKVRDALLILGATLPDTKGMFGSRDEVNAVRHLIGTATAWGGNPEKDAFYLTVTPKANDGRTLYSLKVKDVPVDAFWSISIYNSKGYFEPNALDAYTLNSITAKKDGDGVSTIQFGGCDGQITNCLPITQGWNYMIRLYRPHAEILNGNWTFPKAEPLK